MINKHFVELLKQMEEIHARKNHDYSSIGFYQNFERSATLLSWFRNDMDKTFASLVGTKLARLATLLDNTEAPLNESIDDSFLDLCTYCGLWASWHKLKEDEKNKYHSFISGKTQPSFCQMCGLHQSSHSVNENPLTNQLLDLIKLMPDSQTQEIVDFIMSMREIRGKHASNQSSQSVSDRGIPQGRGGTL